MATIISLSYIDKIERYLGKETNIVLVGQRRVGKSCMMKMIRDRKIADDGNNLNAPSEASVQNQILRLFKFRKFLSLLSLVHKSV